MKEPYIIIITGHSCSGKSTLIKELQKSLVKSYHIGYDKVKWGLAGYDRNSDTGTIRTLLYGFYEVIFRSGISCISDCYFQDEETYKTLIERAHQSGYHVITVVLTCPSEIRIERFRERVERAKQEGMKNISVTDESIFIENMKKDFYFPEDGTSYNTSVQRVEEIAADICESI